MTAHRLAIPFILAGLSACAGSGAASNAPTAGPWAAKEADEAARAFIESCVTSATWPQEFAQANGRKPTVQVATATDETGDELSTSLLTNPIETSLIQRADVEVAASAAAQAEMMAFQAQVMAMSGGEAGGGSAPDADYVVSTVIDSTSQPGADGTLEHYVANMRLVAVPNAEVVCSARAETTKLQESSADGEKDAAAGSEDGGDEAGSTSADPSAAKTDGDTEE